MNFWNRLVNEEDGATATEYAIIVAILGVSLIGIFLAFRTEFSGFFTDFASDVNTNSGVENN